MIKPKFKGKTCGECNYLISRLNFCCAYSAHIDDTKNRSSKCIAEYNLENSQWSLKPPMEEGYYMVLIRDELASSKQSFLMTYEVVNFLEDNEVWVPGEKKPMSVDYVYKWGPKIEFPDLSEGE